MLMYPLVRYYLHQAGHGAAGSRCKHDGIGPIYAAPPFFSGATGSVVFWQGNGEWLGRSSGMVPRLWGRETLRTEGDILTDIATSTDDENPRDIISRRLNETTQSLIGKLRGRGRKRKAGGGGRGVAKRRQKGGKKLRLTKRDIFS